MTAGENPPLKLYPVPKQEPNPALHTKSISKHDCPEHGTKTHQIKAAGEAQPGPKPKTTEFMIKDSRQACRAIASFGSKNEATAKMAIDDLSEFVTLGPRTLSDIEVALHNCTNYRTR